VWVASSTSTGRRVAGFVASIKRYGDEDADGRLDTPGAQAVKRHW